MQPDRVQQSRANKVSQGSFGFGPPLLLWLPGPGRVQSVSSVSHCASSTFGGQLALKCGHHIGVVLC